MNFRLACLLLALAVLAIVRWTFPPNGGEPSVVAAIARDGGRVSTPSSSAPAVAAASDPAAERSMVVANAASGNIFKIRGAVVVAPPAPLVSRPAPRAVSTVAAVDADAPPPAPPPPPPPPLQVIGTWDDGHAPGVFVAGPRGTLLVKPGDVLLDDYKVKAITSRELMLTQLSNQHEWPLSIPIVAQTPPMVLKK